MTGRVLKPQISGFQVVAADLPSAAIRFLNHSKVRRIPWCGSMRCLTYSALCGQGMPAASPQRDAVGIGLALVSSDWRTSSAKTSAKLPNMRKTMIRRATGNMSASSGWRISPGIENRGFMHAYLNCRSVLCVPKWQGSAAGAPRHPMPANMIDPALRELKPCLNHHIRSRRDINRDRLVRRHCRTLVSWADRGSLCRPACPMLPRRWRARTCRRQSVAIGEP